MVSDDERRVVWITGAGSGMAVRATGLRVRTVTSVVTVGAAPVV